MYYWSETAGATVFAAQNMIGQIEDSIIDPENKAVAGFLLERRKTELRYRFLPFSLVEEIKRGMVKLKCTSGIRAMPKNFVKNSILIDDLLKKPVIDDKDERVGRVVDFAFDKNGIIREIIISGSLVEDLWLGRKRMPVLDKVEFSQELIRIDRDTKEEITGLQKGLKKWFNIDTTK